MCLKPHRQVQSKQGRTVRVRETGVLLRALTGGIGRFISPPAFISERGNMGKASKKVTSEKLERIKSLLRRYTDKEIAAMEGVHMSTVWRIRHNISYAKGGK